MFFFDSIESFLLSCSDPSIILAKSLYFIVIECENAVVLYTPILHKNLCSYCLLTQLAEYAHEKTGYFYDESLHKEVRHKLKSKIKRTSSENEVVSPNPNKFKGFDFATHDEEFL